MFDVHIPRSTWREEVCQPMTDSALYWLANYDLDGFRHDACKHIPLNYWRMLGQKMAARFPDRHIWMIGETYGDNHLIGSYVKTGMLPAQFDFNIYHTAIDVLGKPNQSMRRMAQTIERRWQLRATTLWEYLRHTTSAASSLWQAVLSAGMRTTSALAGPARWVLPLTAMLPAKRLPTKPRCCSRSST